MKSELGINRIIEKLKNVKSTTEKIIFYIVMIVIKICA